MKPFNAKHFFDSVAGYFSLSGFLVPQAQAEAEIREGVSFRGTNILILIFAILIASLGLNTNSTAVIIGAMLISPLMGPIIGIGLGVGISDFELLKRCLRNLSIAAGFSVIASTCYFLISPVSENHSELLARTSPTIYDVLIGFFGGAAGIFALASKNKGNVIPGVAIATALMPPLCTAGYGLATFQLYYFFGAFYLFLINSIYIAIATFIGVKVMKFQGVANDVNPARQRRVRRVVYSLAVLTLLPSVYLTYNMLRQARFDQNADRFVAQEFDFPSTQVLSHSATYTRNSKSITVTLIGRILPADSLRMAMNAKLHYYGLQGARLNIVQGEGAAVGNLDSSTASPTEMYAVMQSAISSKQETIDSLRSVLANRQQADTLVARIAPELKVVFPQVKQIAMSRAVFSNITTGRLDTVNVALVQYRQALSPGRQQELSRYLAARIGVGEVRLITVSNP